jgi:hypothetical protein
MESAKVIHCIIPNTDQYQYRVLALQETELLRDPGLTLIHEYSLESEWIAYLDRARLSQGVLEKGFTIFLNLTAIASNGISLQYLKKNNVFSTFY